MKILHITPWTNKYNRGFIGGFYIRPFGPYDKGIINEGHAHYIDHAMFVESGSVQVDWNSPDGRSGSLIVDAPNFITVKAEVKHTIIVRVDGTRWRCIFAEAELEKSGDPDATINNFMLEK